MHESATPSSVVPELRKQVDEAYAISFTVVTKMRIVSFYVDYHERLAGISWFVTDDEVEDRRGFLAEQQRRQKQHEDQCEMLEKILLELTHIQLRLRELYTPIYPLCQFVYPVLRDFESCGYGGRFAYPVIDQLLWKTAAWGRRCLQLYDETQAKYGELTLEDRAECDRVKADFPLKEDLELDLRDRLYLEQSQIQRDLSAYAKTIPSPPVSSEFETVEAERESLRVAQSKQALALEQVCAIIQQSVGINAPQTTPINSAQPRFVGLAELAEVMQLQVLARSANAEGAATSGETIGTYVSDPTTNGKSQKNKGGRKPKTKRTPEESSVMRLKKQYPDKPYYEIDDDLRLEVGESKRIYERVTRRERNQKPKSADKTGQN